MLAHLNALAGYGQYWFVTITPYGREIEPNVPDKEQIIASFQELSRAIGLDCIGWRYDPIFLNDTYTPAFHLQTFEHIAAQLAGYTKTCVISFLDLYPKVVRNFPEAHSVPADARLELGKALIALARRYGMTVRPCAEGDYLAAYGADCRGCMTLETYETALHAPLHAPHLPQARKECACYLACDIGAYNTCGHLCRYCYANYSAALVRQNMAAHDPTSPFLIGGALPGDIVHDADQHSWRDNQLTLWEQAPGSEAAHAGDKPAYPPENKWSRAGGRTL